MEDKLSIAYASLARYDPDARSALGLDPDPDTGRPAQHESLPSLEDCRLSNSASGTPERIRTVATAVRGRRPRPLDDGGLELALPC